MITAKHVWMIEDDPAQANTIFEFLEEKQMSVVRIQTEMEFHEKIVLLKSAEIQRPDLVVSDIMLPWGFAGDFKPEEVPEEVRVGTYRRSGLRCWKRFREDPGNENVPWVYFTILDADAIEFRCNSDACTWHVLKEEGLIKLSSTLDEALAKKR